MSDKEMGMRGIMGDEGDGDGLASLARVVPTGAKRRAGIQERRPWMPAFAGKATNKVGEGVARNSSSRWMAPSSPSSPFNPLISYSFPIRHAAAEGMVQP